MKLKRSSIQSRFSLASVLIVLALALPSLLAINDINKIDTIVADNTSALVNNIQSNADITQKIYELVRQAQALEYNRFYDTAQLHREGLKIDNELEQIKSLSSDEDFLQKMGLFMRSFQRFLGNSLTLSHILVENEDIATRLQAGYDQLRRKIINNIPGDGGDDDMQNSMLILLNAEIQHREIVRLLAIIPGNIAPEAQELLTSKLVNALVKSKIPLNLLQRRYSGLSDEVVAINRQLDRYQKMTSRMQVNFIERRDLREALLINQQALISLITQHDSELQAFTLDTQKAVKHETGVLKGAIIFTSLLVAIGSLLFFGLLIRANIIQPMRRVIDDISHFEAGKLDHLVDLKRSDEWNTIETSFNNMALRLNQSHEDIISERKKFDHIAHHDPLTELPNRLFAYEELARLIKRSKLRQQGFSLIYMDLDEFKQVNDSLGHGQGDRLLSKVAKSLEAVVSDAGVVTRLGGDEFMVIFDQDINSDEVMQRAELISSAIRQPLELGSFSVTIGSSMGICHYPEHGTNVEMLVRNADTAMYHAKKAGKNRVAVYQDSMTSEARGFMEMVTGIRRALDHHEFFLVYQPVYKLGSNSLIGMEALIRWQHPELGLLSPDRFLPVAEQSGLISAVDNWVFTQVCRQLVSWRKGGFCPEYFKIAVNFSGKKFIEPGLASFLSRVLRSTGCRASAIEIEITEQEIMTQVQDRYAIIDELKGMGFSLSIDDFGTGYSSFSYLKNLPVNTLKIDRSFVRDIDTNPRDLAIVKTVLNLANMLEMDVIAEGIETHKHQQLLLEHGCEIGQGYFLSKPLALDAAEALMKSNFLQPSKSHY